MGSAWLFGAPSTTVYHTFESLSQRVFPNATIITHNIELSSHQLDQIQSGLMLKIPSQNIQVFEYKINNKRQGFSMVTNTIGKHYPITCFIAVSPELAIQRVEVMVYRENYGGQVRKRRFLKQFNGKSMQDPILVNQDITSISGATLSAYAVANGVRQVLHSVSALYPDLNLLSTQVADAWQ